MADFLWLRRAFDDVTQGLTDAAMREHIDLTPTASVVDAAQAQRLEAFVRDKLEKLVRNI